MDAPLSRTGQIIPNNLSPLDLPTETKTGRLYLRAYRPGDGVMYYHMLQDNWQHLYEFMPHSYLSIRSTYDADLLILHLVEEWQARHLFIFGVWEQESGAYVGEAYLANADWHVPRIELGYFLVQASTGKGYATEAARALAGYAFEHMHVERIELQCNADNAASIRVAERCGFTFEARMRLRYRKKSGELVDVLWYSLLRSEWYNQIQKV
jgi:RimJ/RimL family protein N-acetyltransferase